MKSVLLTAISCGTFLLLLLQCTALVTALTITDRSSHPDNIKHGTLDSVVEVLQSHTKHTAKQFCKAFLKGNHVELPGDDQLTRTYSHKVIVKACTLYLNTTTSHHHHPAAHPHNTTSAPGTTLQQLSSEFGLQALGLPNTPILARNLRFYTDPITGLMLKPPSQTGQGDLPVCLYSSSQLDGYLRGCDEPGQLLIVINLFSNQVLLSLGQTTTAQVYDPIYCNRTSTSTNSAFSCYAPSRPAYNTFYSCPNQISGSLPLVFLAQQSGVLRPGCTAFNFTTM